jgi:tetratricopeptide (TPR) repeat protein
MQLAGDALGEVPPDNTYQAIIRRTLLQSRLKQYCYVTPDPERADHYAGLLIAADPPWSINWGDKAEMHLRFGEYSKAARAFDVACSLGPPYLRYHLRASAKAYARLGQRDEATARYVALSRLGEMPPLLAKEALEVSVDPAAVALFSGLVD